MKRERLKQLKLFQKRIGVRFRNRDILNLALTHKSYAKERRQESNPFNERMEFLGDSVLGFSIVQYLYRHYPFLQEGWLTKVKSQVVSAAILYKVAERIEIGDYLLLGRGEKKSGGDRQPSNMVCALEAVIGAIYLDRGIKKATKFVVENLKCEIEAIEEGRGAKDYKSLLQESALKVFGAIPEYRLIKQRGPEHKKRFEVEVKIKGVSYGSGTGLNKKSAQQEAAKSALEKMVS